MLIIPFHFFLLNFNHPHQSKTLLCRVNDLNYYKKFISIDSPDYTRVTSLNLGLCQSDIYGPFNNPHDHVRWILITTKYVATIFNNFLEPDSIYGPHFRPWMGIFAFVVDESRNRYNIKAVIWYLYRVPARRICIE